MRRGLGPLVAGVLLAAAIAGCKGTPPPLPPVPANSGSILLPPGSTRTPTPDNSVVDRVVAVVNEDVILMSELQEATLLYLRDSKEAAPSSAQDRERLFQKVLDRMVDHRLQVQEARRDRVEIGEDELVQVMDDFIKRNGGDRSRIEEQLKAQGLSWDIVRRDIRDSLLAQKVRVRRIGRRATVTEAEVDAYLAQNRPKLETDLKYHPRHIAVLAQPPGAPAAWDKAKAEIDALADRLREGADFAELARVHSRDGSASSGGDLGWLKPGELDSVFEGPILKLKKGETSAPIKSANGYHLFRLEDREELTPEMVTQLRQQSRDILVQRKAQERLDDWLQGLRKRALIAERL